jgi:hypothetical protein
MWLSDTKTEESYHDMLSAIRRVRIVNEVVVQAADSFAARRCKLPSEVCDGRL